jgi:hypothetical protein
MATLAIQCGTCKFESYLSYKLSLPPMRVCKQFTKGVPNYVSTIKSVEQEPCPRYEER